MVKKNETKFLNGSQIWFIIHKIYYNDALIKLPGNAIKLYFFLLHQHTRTNYIGDFTKPLTCYRAEGARYKDTIPLSISLIAKKIVMSRRDVKKYLDILVTKGMALYEISKIQTKIYLYPIFQAHATFETTQKPNETIIKAL